MSAATERALDLLVEHATEGLGPRRIVELDDLLAEGVSAPEAPSLDKESFELAAAAIDLAFTNEEPMPTDLRQQVARQAADVLGFPVKSTPGKSSSTVVPFPSPRGEPEKSGGISPWLGWMAAAAALLVAVLGWLPNKPVEDRVAEIVLSPAEARQQLLTQATDVLQIDWTATEDPAAVSAGGDVVWSDALQEGYMRFRGLPINDASVSQYQLWIFDAEQDERYPVDGGVFDITAEGEVVVPIDPKLRIARATLFAITVEKPGGVVVSSRERLPLLAQVS